MTAADAAAEALGELARRDVALGARTTYRVGGPAAVAVEPTSEDDLKRIGDVVRQTGVEVLVVGRGSNLLVADAGFPGLVVLVGDGFGAIDVDGTTVRAGGGASLPVVARRLAAAGLSGFEWAVGVPGSVGGAVRMNAGGHGADIAACLLQARVVDLTTGGARWRPAADLELGYRTSAITATDVVVAADIGCTVGDRAVAEAAIADIVEWRRTHQPGGRNAGSVFTNPPGEAAGLLVERAGLKGFRRGTAQVSAKHANFIQADEGGSADDVKRLMDEVREIVHDRTGVELRTEVRLIGFAGAYPQDMEGLG